MKVFGIGLNKTGTTSLAKALKILGFKKAKGCDWELTKQWSKGNIGPILETANEYNNFQDWPWPLIYKYLFDSFSDSKFILTKRATPDDWYNSLCKHALKTGPTEFRKIIYGYYMPQNFKKEHINFYNAHNNEVARFFNKYAPEKLLVISLREGNNWKKLCGFLNKDIPKSKFPYLNKSRKEKYKN